MIRSRAALAASLFAVIATVAVTPLAATERDAAPARGEESEITPASSSWVPEWLVETFDRAIADATDPSDRHASR